MRVELRAEIVVPEGTSRGDLEQALQRGLPAGSRVLGLRAFLAGQWRSTPAPVPA